ncbi:MAG: CheR family methyltransferase [Myxococcota bacterium]
MKAFTTLSALVERRLGLQLDQTVDPMQVRQVIERRAAWQGMSEEEYVARLADDDAAWRDLIPSLTNGQTSWFRDPEVFDMLRAHLSGLPPRQRVRMWSAACSTGQEAWSLALTSAEAGRSTEIYATDVNPHALETARTGLYQGWGLRGLPEEIAHKYFDGEGVTRSIRTLVDVQLHFMEHNLWAEKTPFPEGLRFDVILCRNVLIYFHREQVPRLIRQFAAHLDEGGLLILGGSESLLGLEVPLEAERRHGRVVYTHPNGGSRSAPPKDPRRSSLPLPSSNSTAPVPPTEIPRKAPPLDGGVPSFAVTTSHADLSLPGWVVGCLAQRDADAALALLEERRASLLPSELLLARGHALSLGHRFTEALEHYERVLLFAPLAWEPHAGRGLVHKKRGQHDEARLALERAVFLAPNAWEPSFLLLGVYARLGRAVPRERAYARSRRLLLAAEGAGAAASGLSALLPPVEELLTGLAELRPEGAVSDDDTASLSVTRGDD